MSHEKKKDSEAEEKLAQQALEKYKELYNYSTDILLNELERFNRADEKAAKLSAVAFTRIDGHLGGGALNRKRT